MIFSQQESDHRYHLEGSLSDIVLTKDQPAQEFLADKNILSFSKIHSKKNQEKVDQPVHLNKQIQKMLI